MKRSTRLAGVAAFVALMASGAARAGNSTDFRPMDPTLDGPYIRYSSIAAYNVDANSRNVVGAVGQVVVTGVPVSYNVQLYTKNNGGSLVCRAWGVSMGNGTTTWGAAASTAVNGVTNFTIPITLSAAGTWAVNIVCMVPGANANGNSQLFGYMVR